VEGRFCNTLLHIVTVRGHKHVLGCYLLTRESNFTFQIFLFFVSGKQNLHACDVMSSVISPYWGLTVYLSVWVSDCHTVLNIKYEFKQLTTYKTFY
jgi:hypothetical protein